MNYEFKGTKKKWMVDGNTLYALCRKDNIIINKFYAEFYPDWNNDEAISELKYNIKPASKAPEMFDMLKKVLDLSPLLRYSGKIKSEHIGEAEAVGNLLDDIEQLLKEASAL